ncbi:hypothetical protein PM082_018115 [Marasmius tenuissimus]|nr:hypothetical protein PM082_018115 [Marasmius tenuissimus]
MARDLFKGRAQLEILMGVLERVAQIGCVDCWVLGNIHTDSPAAHRRTGFFLPQLNQIRRLATIPYKHWPCCWHCWVPLREPCGHPPPAPNRPIDPERCTFRPFDVVTKDHLPVILWIIALVYGRNDAKSNGKTYREGIESALGVQWRSIVDLVDWLKQPVDELAELNVLDTKPYSDNMKRSFGDQDEKCRLSDGRGQLRMVATTRELPSTTMLQQLWERGGGQSRN